MPKTILRPVFSAIYDVNHSHRMISDDEVGFCFSTSVSLVHKSGHTFTMDHKQWEEMGEPAKVKITVSPADA